jgi:hypothetical protein
MTKQKTKSQRSISDRWNEEVRCTFLLRDLLLFQEVLGYAGDLAGSPEEEDNILRALSCLQKAINRGN